MNNVGVPLESMLDKTHSFRAGTGVPDSHLSIACHKPIGAPAWHRQCGTGTSKG